jgi:hypothetical protein
MAERGGYTSGEATAGDFPVPPGVPVRKTVDGGHAVLLSDMVRASGMVRAPVAPRFLTEDQVRQLLSECVTVVKPGETLVLRTGREWTPSQMREVQDMLDEFIKWRKLPFRAMVVPADDLAVAQREDDCAFAERVARAIQHLNLQRRFPTRRGT